jgi:hypothetical protein
VEVMKIIEAGRFEGKKNRLVSAPIKIMGSFKK